MSHNICMLQGSYPFCTSLFVYNDNSKNTLLQRVMWLGITLRFNDYNYYMISKVLCTIAKKA